ncbi:MAG: efflux RND transporter periplasmic adaptor subunit [bacterium]
MKNKYIIIITAVFLALLTGILIYHNSQKTCVKSNSDIVELCPKAIQDLGVKTIVVERKPVISEIRTIGEIKTNQDKRYVLSPIVVGRVIQDNVVLGQEVKKGQVIARVENINVAQINANSVQRLHENILAIKQAQTKLRLAKTNLDREKKLFAEGISAKKSLIQAESDYAIARDDLSVVKERDMHIRAEANSLLKIYGTSTNLNSDNIQTTSAIIALRPGIITKKNVTVGATVSPDQILYEVSDLSSLWLDMTIYPEYISKIREGQEVIFKSDSMPNKTFVGKISYIQPSSDDPTKTFLARVFMDNSSKLLRPGMFGQIFIKEDEKQLKIFVPNEAIQEYGKESFVFVYLSDGKYKKQTIKLSETGEGGHFIDEGLKAGDKIVTQGSFTLKSELIKKQFEQEEE